MNATRMFRCCACDSLHDDEWDAEECCPPEVDELWFCGECDDEHGTQQAAADCCGGDPLDTPVGWQRHIEELERAGQLRLDT